MNGQILLDIWCIDNLMSNIYQNGIPVEIVEKIWIWKFYWYDEINEPFIWTENPNGNTYLNLDAQIDNISIFSTNLSIDEIQLIDNHSYLLNHPDIFSFYNFNSEELR